LGKLIEPIVNGDSVGLVQRIHSYRWFGWASSKNR